MSCDPEGVFFSNPAQSYYKHSRAYDKQLPINIKLFYIT